MADLTGTIFNVQRFSTEDGPGIRTTVFMKGCPMRCAWCHNPEGLTAQPELMWYDVRCIAAKDCLSVCHEGALLLTPKGMVIDRERCTACGECIPACPSSALEIIGHQWTVEELLEELLKDEVFYETSGGGVTFSGGEPLVQSDFLQPMLSACKESGLHIALDTCGALPWDRYERVLSFLDLVLFDLKIMDSLTHKEATGVTNHQILDNARKLSASKIPMWIRTPVIPGFTQSIENVQQIAAFIGAELPTAVRWDLLAYTNLGKPKYRRLDLPYPLEDEALLTSQEMEDMWRAAVDLVPFAIWSGATRNPTSSKSIGGEVQPWS